MGGGFGGAMGVHYAQRGEEAAEQSPPPQRRNTLKEGAGAVVVLDGWVAKDGSVAFRLHLALECLR